MNFKASAYGKLWDVTTNQAAIAEAVASLLPGRHGPLSVTAVVKGYSWPLWLQPIKAEVLPNGGLRAQFRLEPFGTVTLEGGFGGWRAVAVAESREAAVCV